jgi:hypothetical protein
VGIHKFTYRYKYAGKGVQAEVFHFIVMPLNARCPYRKWKSMKLGIRQIEIGKKEKLEVPTILELDLEGNSYSDRCKGYPEVKLDGKVPSFVKLKGGKKEPQIIINPKSIESIGLHKFWVI